MKCSISGKEIKEGDYHILIKKVPDNIEGFWYIEKFLIEKEEVFIRLLELVSKELEWSNINELIRNIFIDNLFNHIPNLSDILWKNMKKLTIKYGYYTEPKGDRLGSIEECKCDPKFQSELSELYLNIIRNDKSYCNYDINSIEQWYYIFIKEKNMVDVKVIFEPIDKLSNLRTIIMKKNMNSNDAIKLEKYLLKLYMNYES